MAKSFTEDPLYDYESAREAGQGPSTKPGPNLGHWDSRVASGPKEGLMLKSVDHPTFNLGVQGERKMGYRMSSGPDGRIWSQPPEKPLPKGHTALTYVGEPIKTEKLP
jgi:hypothetical protein